MEPRYYPDLIKIRAVMFWRHEFESGRKLSSEQKSSLLIIKTWIIIAADLSK